MDTAGFLGTVLAAEGFYCLLALHGTDNKRVQKFYKTQDQLCAAAQQFDASGYNTYFALATFNDGHSREVSNVKLLKSLFLDLDCVPGKDYPDQQQGLRALKRLCTDLALPKPTIVNSGRGLHVYWALKTPVSYDEWHRAALRVKHGLIDRGFPMDRTVPSDGARVLRIPGTRNFKSDPPSPVTIIMMGEPIDDLTVFAEKFPEVALPPPKTEKKELSAVMVALTANSVNNFKLILDKTAAGRGCAQIARIVSEQATLDEPSWRAGLSIAQHCEDRAKAIHFISRKHPEYDHRKTEEKAAAIAAPYLCSTFASFFPAGCEGCPHIGRIKTPIALGHVVREATEGVVVMAVPTPPAPVETPETDEPIPAVVVATAPVVYQIPKYPAPYFRGKNGGVYKNTQDENGDPVQVQVYHNDIYVTQRIFDPDVGECVVMRLHLPKDAIREFTVPLSAASSAEEMRKVLSANGVGVLKALDLMTYVIAWVNELQSQASADKARRQYGWVDDKGTAFVMGDQEIHGSYIAHNPPSVTTAQSFPYFKPKGDMQKWKEVMAFYDKPGMELHQYMLGIGFGSVLLHMLPIFGAGFHIFSKGSGFGKTTAMYVGASIWGYPKKLVLSANDTVTTKMNRAELYRHLPLYIDELTNSSGKELSDLAYQMTHGEQRNRGRSSTNVERHRGEPWALLCGTTGNKSIWEALSGYKSGIDAEMQRMMEMQVYKASDISKEETDELSEKIMNNYGHAAIPYIQYICNNYEKVKKELQDTQRTMDQLTGMTSQNRFWSAKIACVVMGIRLAKRLKFVNYNIPRLIDWIVDMVKRASVESASTATDAVELLNLYYLENYNNILRIRSNIDGRGAQDMLIQPEAAPRGTYIARYEYDLKKLYIVPRFFKEWCVKQQLHYRGIDDDLKKPPLNATSVRIRLGRGTTANMPSMWVTRVHFDDSAEVENDKG